MYCETDEDYIDAIVLESFFHTKGLREHEHRSVIYDESVTLQGLDNRVYEQRNAP